MARILVFMAAFTCAVLLVWPSHAAIGMTAAIDRISIECWKTNSGFAMKITYTAAHNRLILANVIDSRGEGHRILRRTVKAGKNTIEWSARKNRFGELSRGCVAMHKVDYQKRTVAWDCDKF